MAKPAARRRSHAPAQSAAERYSAYVESYNAQVLQMLEENKAPWQRLWEPGQGGDALPHNAVTGKAYTGANSMFLIAQQIEHGYVDPRWLTCNQSNALGCRVRKGEKGTQLVKWVEVENKRKEDQGKDNEERKRLIPVLFTVFNGEQIEGMPPLPAREPKPEMERHAECERLIAESGANIQHNGGNRAYYRPATDSIHLPEREQFKSPDAFYATALHELGHWTGHESRLNRDLSGGFGSERYAREELRAEIASFMIGQRLEIGHDPSQHAAYLQSWIKVVKEDPKAILHACKDAEAICQHLGVLKLEYEPTQKVERELEPEPPLMPLLAAAKAGNVVAIQRHVAAGTNLDDVDLRGMTAAHLALHGAYAFDHRGGGWGVSEPHLSAFQALREAGARMDLPNRFGFTVRQQAQMMGLFDEGGPTTPQALLGEPPGRVPSPAAKEAMRQIRHELGLSL